MLWFRIKWRHIKEIPEPRVIYTLCPSVLFWKYTHAKSETLVEVTPNWTLPFDWKWSLGHETNQLLICLSFCEGKERASLRCLKRSKAFRQRALSARDFEAFAQSCLVERQALTRAPNHSGVGEDMRAQLCRLDQSEWKSLVFPLVRQVSA